MADPKKPAKEPGFTKPCPLRAVFFSSFQKKTDKAL